MSHEREIYRSPDGDCWYVACDANTGNGYVLHQPNSASGGLMTRIEVADFLGENDNAPQQRALLRLIGTLAEGSPDSSGSAAVAKIRSVRSR